MKVVYALFVVIALGVLGTVGFLTYKDVNKPKAKTAQIQSENDLNPNQLSQNQNQTESVTLGVTNEPAPSQSTVPLNSTGQQAQNSSSPVLDPSQFSAYETYKTSNELLSIDIRKGSGAEAVQGKKVAVLYKGWLTDGTVFDQSRMNEDNQLQPFVFTPGAGQVIPGWEQGLLGMKVGGTRRLVLPPQAGYGSQGQGAIPPDSVLIFDIQLLEVEP